MDHKMKTEFPGYVFDIFRNTKQDDFNYIYRGYFSRKITDNILSLAEKNIQETDDPAVIKRRVYFIMVESLQNITRYQATDVHYFERSSVFVIQKKGPIYFITTGNLIFNNKVPYVRSQLERINGLDPNDLKKYYRNILDNGRFTNEGGAGLGLIEMVRKSGNKLAFDFKPINDECSFFYLHTVITTSDDIDKSQLDLNESLRYITDLHAVLNKDSTSLIFNSGFSQENLLNLLSVIEQHLIDNGPIGKKMFNIMVEMLQNIIHHATADADNLSKPGIFYLRDLGDEYLLHAGNYIRNEKVKVFKEKLKTVNQLSGDELSEFYDKRLFEVVDDSPTGSGLGIIDMRLKSDNRLTYNFHKIDEMFNFFILQSSIVKHSELRT